MRKSYHYPLRDESWIFLSLRRAYGTLHHVRPQEMYIWIDEYRTTMQSQPQVRLTKVERSKRRRILRPTTRRPAPNQDPPDGPPICSVIEERSTGHPSRRPIRGRYGQFLTSFQKSGGRLSSPLVSIYSKLNLRGQYVEYESRTERTSSGNRYIQL